MSNTHNPPYELQSKLTDITLFTSTFYGNDEATKLRQGLALELFDRLDALGVPLVVSDGGSNTEFLEQAALHPNITLVHDTPGGTMGESRRLALDTALSSAKDDPNHISSGWSPKK